MRLTEQFCILFLPNANLNGGQPGLLGEVVKFGSVWPECPHLAILELGVGSHAHLAFVIRSIVIKHGAFRDAHLV